MPTQVDAWKCDICGTVFTGPNSKEQAQNCEERLTPKFALEIGTKFWKAPFFSTYYNNKKHENEIIGRKMSLVTWSEDHIPFYMISNNTTGQVMKNWYSETAVLKEIERGKKEFGEFK